MRGITQDRSGAMLHHHSSLKWGLSAIAKQLGGVTSRQDASSRSRCERPQDGTVIEMVTSPTWNTKNTVPSRSGPDSLERIFI